VRGDGTGRDGTGQDGTGRDGLGENNEGEKQRLHPTDKTTVDSKNGDPCDCLFFFLDCIIYVQP